MATVTKNVQSGPLEIAEDPTASTMRGTSPK